MREADLAPLLATFHALPQHERQPTLPDTAEAKAPKRPVPLPPKGGLIGRGYCTYMKANTDAQPRRAKQFYYKENPDAWAAETQSDMFRLTEPEWRSLIPTESQFDTEIDVSEAI